MSCADLVRARIFGHGVSKVIRSENPKFSVGDHIAGIHRKLSPAYSFELSHRLVSICRICDLEGSREPSEDRELGGFALVSLPRRLRHARSGHKQ